MIEPMTAFDHERLLVQAAIAMVREDPDEQVVLSGLRFGEELLVASAAYARALGVSVERVGAYPAPASRIR